MIMSYIIIIQVVVIILTLVVFLAVKKWCYLRVKPPVRRRKKNRGDGVVVGRYNVRTMTREQKYVYKKYFTSGALTFGKIKDDKYLALVQQELQKRNVRRRALEHLGIAPEQVAEAGELSFKDFYYTDGVLMRNGNSSKFAQSFIFFSDEQVFVYKYIFDMCDDSETERVGEYFYKDITSLSVRDTVKEFTRVSSGGCLRLRAARKGYLKTTALAIVVPDETFVCSMRTTDKARNALFAMQQKVREKKA